MLLPPQFASIIEDFAINQEPIRLFVYKSTEDDQFNPPGFLTIFDYELNEAELEEYSLIFVKTRRAYGLYMLSNEGAEYIGLGDTPEEALAHGVYQIVRRDHWHSELPFLPSVEFTEAWIADEVECLPAQYAVHMTTEELKEYDSLDSVWVTEYAPSQFIWSPNFVNAVEALLPHIPQSWKVH